MCIRMLHLFQRVESIHETEAGLSLSLSTHFYLVSVQTANEGRCKIKMWGTFLSQKWSVQAEVVLSHKKQQSLVKTELLKIMTNFILNFSTNQKLFYCFYDYHIIKSNVWAINQVQANFSPGWYCPGNIQEQPYNCVSQKCSSKLCKIHRTIPVLEFLFSKQWYNLTFWAVAQLSEWNRTFWDF